MPPGRAAGPAAFDRSPSRTRLPWPGRPRCLPRGGGGGSPSSRRGLRPIVPARGPPRLARYWATGVAQTSRVPVKNHLIPSARLCWVRGLGVPLEHSAVPDVACCGALVGLRCTAALFSFSLQLNCVCGIY